MRDIQSRHLFLSAVQVQKWNTRLHFAECLVQVTHLLSARDKDEDLGLFGGLDEGPKGVEFLCQGRDGVVLL